jgi:hypothetical protein
MEYLRVWLAILLVQLAQDNQPFVSPVLDQYLTVHVILNAPRVIIYPINSVYLVILIALPVKIQVRNA